MANPGTDLSFTDIGRRFGIAQKRYSVQNVKDYLDVMGYDITMATADFPRYVAFLQGLGWTNTEILDRTFFTCAWNEAVLSAVPAGEELSSRARLFVPPVKGWFNSELLCGQGTIQCSGSSWNYGQGGTELVMDGATFKSIYDLGVTERHGVVSMNLYGSSSPFGFAGDWIHNGKLIDCHLTGDGGDFNDSAYLSNGVMFQRPGETSFVQNVYFESWNDYGFASYLGGAPTRCDNCSFFYNGKGGAVVLDGALGVCTFDAPSGDQNPALVVAAHWTHPTNPGVSIGGEITIKDPKVEGYSPTMGSIVHGSPGKGQCVFWFEGEAGGANTYFHALITGGQAFMHGGYQNSLIRLNNFNTGGIDHFIVVKSLRIYRYKYLVHDVPRSRKYKTPGWFTEVGGPFNGQERGPDFTLNVPEWSWNNIDNNLVLLGKAATSTITFTSATSTQFNSAADYDPVSSYLPQTYVPPVEGAIWDDLVAANNLFGVNPVTGASPP